MTKKFSPEFLRLHKIKPSKVYLLKAFKAFLFISSKIKKHYRKQLKDTFLFFIEVTTLILEKPNTLCTIYQKKHKSMIKI